MYRPIVPNEDHHHHHGPFVPVPLSDVITEQPIQSYGSQISTGLPVTFGTSARSSQAAPAMMSPGTIGIPLPGLEILDRIPFLKVHDLGESLPLSSYHSFIKVNNKTVEYSNHFVPKWYRKLFEHTHTQMLLLLLYLPEHLNKQ